MKKTSMLLSLAILALALCLCCAAASAETTATLKNSLSYDSGTTTISWDVSGDEPSSYRVYVQVINNGDAAQTNWNLGETTSHWIRTTECLPGKSYKVTLATGDFTILDTREYTLSEAPIFEDGKLKNTSVKVTIEPRRIKAGGNFQKDTKKVNALKASEIKAALDDESAYYGIKYQMRMPQLAKGRSFFVTLAFESPDGYLDVEQATDITFDRVNNGYQTLWWNLTGANFFNYLNKMEGDIPTGKYTVYLYWDGMWVNTSTFNVK